MSIPNIKKILTTILPWIITIVSIHFAFSGINWQIVLEHVDQCIPEFLLIATLLTISSYLLRSRRWQYLLPTNSLSYKNSVRVLWLGFFMNNVLPARAGELVRAHMGAKLSNLKRTLVLATIASERLVDGLTLSLFFVCCSLTPDEKQVSSAMNYVALLFACAAGCVLLVLSARKKLEGIIIKFTARSKRRSSQFITEKIKNFLEGLSPLSSPLILSKVLIWSLLVWGIELAVYHYVAKAFNAELTIDQLVIFLVAVNFSSLIPAAPGGIGTIEAVASSVLISIGVPREQAITMVLFQHIIQYTVIGLPGIIFTLTWKQQLSKNHLLNND